MFPRGCHVGNQSFHIGSIHAQRDHAGSFHLGSGRLSEQLSIERADTDWKYESALAQSRRLRLSPWHAHNALRIKNALPAGGGRIACRTSVGAFDGPAAAAGSAVAGAASADRSWRSRLSPHFQVSYFGSVVNRIVATARNARYLIRHERTHRRHVSWIFASKSRMPAWQCRHCKLLYLPSKWIVLGGVLTYSM
jgi:hypothetical protein